MGVKLFAPRAVGPEPSSASPEPLSGQSLPALGRPMGRYREAAALLLFTSAAFILLALMSAEVDPFDPTLGERNWVGPAGAAVATFLAQGFGLVSWLAPFELALIGAPLFRGRTPANLGLRVAGDLVVAVVLAALLQVAAPTAEVFGHARAGGNVGLLFGELMREFFSTAGSFLIGPTVVGLILIGRSSFSFIALCQRTFDLVQRTYARLVGLARKFLSAWLEARRLRKDEILREKIERQPVIDTHQSDAAILHALEDDDSDWIPMEQTGVPPLALSQSLKNARPASFSLLLDPEPEQETGSPPAVTVTPPPATAKLVDKPSKGAKSSKAERSSRAEKAEKSDKSEKADQAEKSDKANNAEKATKPEKKRAKRKVVEEVEETGDDEEADSASDELEEEDGAELESEDGDEEDVDDEEASAPAPAKTRTKTEEGEPRIVDTQPERAVERPATVTAPTKRGSFQLPESSLLDAAPEVTVELDREKILEHANRLEKTLLDYGVTGKVEEIHPGPTVTTYEVSCEAGTKVSKVASLADDLALGLSRKVRIIAPIPGKSRIGFELPNDERVPVNLRELIEDQRFDKLSERAPLPVVLGRDIVGAPFYADLASMPHVIVAGATGAGKSVGLNVMLSSLLFKRSPEELRLLMIDPKVVELAPFDGIPHMLLPVVTDMKQAATALRWAVDEMERRYQLFANAGTKNITTYNAWVKRVHDGEAPAPKPEEVEALSADGALVTIPAAKRGGDGVALPGKLPYIVIVVDEFADLMMQQGKEVEASVARLAQKARAAGMHVVLATQRPSVDVITGMIKANFPSRIGFRVAQKVDSRTILDEQGAELLLGRGDMLVKLNGSTDTRRVQCPFVSEEEVSRLTDYLRTQGSPEYHDAILRAGEEEDTRAGEDEPADPRFEEAVLIVRDTQRCSTSWLQRKMTIGYNRAAKIVEMMEKRGMVGPPNGAREREVLIPP
jgi:S-DNA-T family DNA segregation ATPase FtsK/SpoIIIE